MECNKDEAIRAKVIAERKVIEKDYTEAKKFAVKAQNLYPGLSGISEILATINVYISAEKQSDGEVDWYRVLDLSPSADDEAVKKHFKKFALMLHPDKNKSVGAAGAFKLISDAWSLLSDKRKRLEYNWKLNQRINQQIVPTQSRTQPAPPSTNGFHSSSSQNGRKQNNIKAKRYPPVPPTTRPDTFWTICDKCRTHYEYSNIYLNHILLCPSCHKPFQALQRDPPSIVLNNVSGQHQDSRSHAAQGNPFDYGRNSRTAQANSSKNADFPWGCSDTTEASHSATAQAANVVRQAQENVRRDRGQAWAEWERHKNSQISGYSGVKVEKKLKSKKTDYGTVNKNVGESASVALGSGAGWGSKFGIGSFQAEDKNNNFGTHLKPSIKRDPPDSARVREMLKKRATVEISKKLHEWRLEKKTCEKITTTEIEKKKYKAAVNGNTCDLDDRLDVSKNATFSHDDIDEGATINVPDSDFHNFDLDRTESSFREDQVWAAYDHEDGMPRYYARIQKVSSMNPFKILISWLNSRTTFEFGSMEWISFGFTKTCGHFRVGKLDTSTTLNSFSHPVKWTKGARGAISIFPGKGEVWAVYRNWSSDWNGDTTEQVRHKYDMVEVLDDYNDEQGASVAPLVKVTGFRTVFQKHPDPKELRRIPKEEMFRFSHQVPYHLLTGQEAPNVPVGCLELDPAATPVELLQVVMEKNDDEAGEGMAARMDLDDGVLHDLDATIQG